MKTYFTLFGATILLFLFICLVSWSKDSNYNFIIQSDIKDSKEDSSYSNNTENLFKPYKENISEDNPSEEHIINLPFNSSDEFQPIHLPTNPNEDIQYKNLLY